MMNYGMVGMRGGMHVWGFVIGALVLVLLVLLVIWLVKSIFFSGRGSASAKALLDERLARGDISVREYEQIKKAIERR
jgi:uncharacterized membrane protein